MKGGRVFIGCLLLLLCAVLLPGCVTKYNKVEMEEALRLVQQIPFPVRYSQYDGRQLTPYDIRVKTSLYNQYDGSVYYQFTCKYYQPNTNWLMQLNHRNLADVVLVKSGYGYTKQVTDDVVYEMIDHTKAWYPLDVLRSDFDDFSWQ